AGYMFLEDYNFLDALYMTVITLATVGFSEVKPLSPEGRIFTIFVIFGGLTIFLYFLGVFTALLVEGEIVNYFKGVKMKKIILGLENHYIVVGYGRTGENLVESFVNKNLPFVLIEKDPIVIDKFISKYHSKVLSVLGDATDDQILIEAGIKSASTIIPVLSSDADNLFTTMSAKILNPNVKVVTRINDSSNYNKLKKAGASNILSPYEITAERMFSLATEANILTFLDLTEGYHNTKELTIAKIAVTDVSDLIGKTLAHAEIPKKTGLIVIGIARSDSLILNPISHTVIEKNDKFLVIGYVKQIKNLEKLCS
ncbi:MAG: potassium channel protein, partial [Cetobacterium sp.]